MQFSVLIACSRPHMINDAIKLGYLLTNLTDYYRKRRRSGNNQFVFWEILSRSLHSSGQNMSH